MSESSGSRQVRDIPGGRVKATTATKSSAARTRTLFTCGGSAKKNVAGSETLPWSGGKTGDGYAAQGNLLAGPEVVDAMAATFETTEGELASRLVAALAAGQSAGGDEG